LTSFLQPNFGLLVSESTGSNITQYCLELSEVTLTIPTIFKYHSLGYNLKNANQKKIPLHRLQVYKFQYLLMLQAIPRHSISFY
jgi:hypothetical protein